jgi:hypothetical protein
MDMNWATLVVMVSGALIVAYLVIRMVLIEFTKKTMSNVSAPLGIFGCDIDSNVKLALELCEGTAWVVEGTSREQYYCWNLRTNLPDEVKALVLVYNPEYISAQELGAVCDKAKCEGLYTIIVSPDKSEILEMSSTVWYGRTDKIKAPYSIQRFKQSPGQYIDINGVLINGLPKKSEIKPDIPLTNKGVRHVV